MARLEGRVLKTLTGFSSRTFESLYLVEEVHEFIPMRGATGRGLVRFYGQRLRRSYVQKAPRVWDTHDPTDHVVFVEDVYAVYNPSAWPLYED